MKKLYNISNDNQKSYLIPELAEFIHAVEAIYGLYLDAITAFHIWREKIVSYQKQINAKTKLSLEEIDKQPFAYGQFISTEIFKSDHQCTQQELKERLMENGSNYRSIANACIVLIYQYWDYYRGKIESQYGLEKDSIISDVMGDIRFYRRSIIHNKGIGTDMNKCKVLKWFKNGGIININKEQFKKIIELIRQEVSDIDHSIDVHNRIA